MSTRMSSGPSIARERYKTHVPVTIPNGVPVFLHHFSAIYLL
jgi:hypothetical protein